jgi:hypothetical protein
MPREGAIIFSDLIGKLDVLRIECAKCGRSGRYWLHDLVIELGMRCCTVSPGGKSDAG